MKFLRLTGIARCFCFFAMGQKQKNEKWKMKNERLWLGRRKNKHSQHLKFTNQKGGIEGGKGQKKRDVFISSKIFFRGLT